MGQSFYGIYFLKDLGNLVNFFNLQTSSFNMTLPSQIKICDTFGRTVYESNLIQFNQLLDLNHLSNGLYHLTVGNNIKTSKSTVFVINR